MITEAQKYILYGMKEDIELFYERAQIAGFIEFIGSRTQKSLDRFPEELQVYVSAIKELRRIPPVSQEQSVWDVTQALSIARQITFLKVGIEHLQEERRMTRFEIVRASPFGDFSIEDVECLEKHHWKMQFFCAKTEKRESVLTYPELLYLSSEGNLDYFLSLSPCSVSYPELMEMRVEKPLGVLSLQLDHIQEEMQVKEKELHRLAGFLECLQDAFAEALDKYHLELAKTDVDMPMEEGSLFCVEAWIPKTKRKKMLSLLSGLAVHCEEIQIEKEDAVPTILDNKGVQKIGEDLVRVYDCPASGDRDPSGWVFWFFAFFFAIIVADGGYGLLYLGVAIYLKWKFRTFKGMAKRMFRLLIVLSSFIVVWGVLTTSFFGMNISQENPLRKVSLFQWLVEKKATYHLQHKDAIYQEWVERFPSIAKASTGKEFLHATAESGSDKQPLAAAKFNDNILIEFSLFIGVVHVCLSLLRYARRNYASIGWFCFLVGGYLVFPSAIDALSMFNVLTGLDPAMTLIIGKQIFYGGLILGVLMLFLQHGWKGIKEIPIVIQLFGDILSYLRLYALALAGGMMATTFNEMGEMVGIIGGTFVILAGHVMNMGLGIMSGVIHGLRLNFIEWYHYSFVGGGRYFNPLRRVKLQED